MTARNPDQHKITRKLAKTHAIDVGAPVHGIGGRHRPRAPGNAVPLALRVPFWDVYPGLTSWAISSHAAGIPERRSRLHSRVPKNPLPECRRPIPAPSGIAVGAPAPIAGVPKARHRKAQDVSPGYCPTNHSNAVRTTSPHLACGLCRIPQYSIISMPRLLTPCLFDHSTNNLNSFGGPLIQISDCSQEV